MLAAHALHAEPRITTLANGVRVVSETVPGLYGTAIGIWLGSGSIDEHTGTDGTAREVGGMHFLEHVLFKGTHRYSGTDIATRMDLLGADFNAFTGKEHTCFHAQVPAANTSGVIDILASVVTEGTCADADVATERGVITDELVGRDDDPEDIATEIGYEMTFPEHPLGRSILGTRRDVDCLTPDTLRTLHQRALDPARIVLAAAGPVDHDTLVADVTMTPLAQLAPRPAQPTTSTNHAADTTPLRAHPGSVRLVRMPGQQLHVCLSALGPARNAALRPATHVAATALGGGVSSRLFSRVRERLGIAYTIFAGVEQFDAASIVQVTASAPIERATDLVTATAAELEHFSLLPPDEDELRRAQAFARSSVLLGRDDPMTRMTRLGRHVLDRGQVVPVAQSLARIDAVTTQQVAAAWEELTAMGWHAVVLGPQRRRRLARTTRALEPHTHPRGDAR